MRKALALTVLLLVLPVFSAQAAHPAMPDPDKLVRGYCSRVVDGDTAWIEVVEDAIPVAHTYRLIGVDTPETVHPDKPAQFFGKEASAFTAATLQNKWVYIEYDLEKTDDYKRHLGYVWQEDGTLFNMTLLEQGYGKFMVIAPNVRYSAFFIAAQKEAQKAEAGIWAPAPAKVMQIDLKGMTLEELQALQARITDELQNRSDTD